MKKLKTISALSLAIITLTSCTSNETPPANENIEVESPGTNLEIETIPADSPEERLRQIEERGRDDVDEYRRSQGFSNEETLNRMLEEFNGNEFSNIILGTAMEITYGEGHRGMIWENAVVHYSFKITDNLTGNDLPEYITVKSYSGDIFEIGKEYCVHPNHQNTTLWDIHHISYRNVISKDLLSETDIDNIRKSAANKRTSGEVISTVIDSASLDSDFVAKVDLAMAITITDKRKEELADNIFDVQYKLNEVLYLNKKYEQFLPDWLSAADTFGERINSDVEVGETYLVMFVAENNGQGGYFTMPAARNGAVVSVLSPDYERYRLAFLELQ